MRFVPLFHVTMICAVRSRFANPATAFAALVFTRDRAISSPSREGPGTSACLAYGLRLVSEPSAVLAARLLITQSIHFSTCHACASALRCRGMALRDSQQFSRLFSAPLSAGRHHSVYRLHLGLSAGRSRCRHTQSMAMLPRCLCRYR